MCTERLGEGVRQKFKTEEGGREGGREVKVSYAVGNTRRINAHVLSSLYLRVPAHPPSLLPSVPPSPLTRIKQD